MAGLAIAGVPAIVGRPGVFNRPGNILEAQGKAYETVANAQAGLANSVLGVGDPNQSIFQLFQASTLIGLLQVFFKSAIQRSKEFIKIMGDMRDIGNPS